MYGKSTNRKKVPHIPFAIDRDILRSLVNKFHREFEVTSSNRFRSGKDMQFAFSYSHFIINERKWPYEIDETDSTWHLVSVGKSLPDLEQQLNKVKNNPKKFLCVNDDIDYNNTNEAVLLRGSINRFYEQIFPDKSQFEV